MSRTYIERSLERRHVSEGYETAKPHNELSQYIIKVKTSGLRKFSVAIKCLDFITAFIPYSYLVLAV